MRAELLGSSSRDMGDTLSGSAALTWFPDSSSPGVERGPPSSRLGDELSGGALLGARSELSTEVPPASLLVGPSPGVRPTPFCRRRSAVLGGASLGLEAALSGRELLVELAQEGGSSFGEGRTPVCPLALGDGLFSCGAMPGDLGFGV